MKGEGYPYVIIYSVFGGALMKRFGFALLSASTLGLVSCGGSGLSADETTTSDLQAAFRPSVLASTKVWQVTASVLNCRASASTAAPVVFELRRGLVVDTVLGAPTVSAGGFTWLKVNPRGDLDHNDCYVAADDRFLTPATRIVAENYLESDLFEAKSFKVKVPLNCRQGPWVASAVVFSSMPVGTIVDVDPITNSDFSFVQWNGDSYWVHVNPRGDTDHNSCWISAKKPNVTLSKVTL
jgi:hypothetical protein